MHNLGDGGRDERKFRYVMPESGMEVGVWWGMREGGCHIEGVEGERISKTEEKLKLSPAR